MFDSGSTFGWFDLVGLALTLIGLTVTGAQARSARTAAEAAREATQTTERELAKNQLLLTLAGVQQIIGDIESAASADDKSVTIFSLVRFGVAATEAKELLVREQSAHKPLADDLARLSREALDLKAALAKSTSLKVARTSDPLRGDLGVLNLSIQEATTRVRFKTEGSKNVQ